MRESLRADDDENIDKSLQPPHPGFAPMQRALVAAVSVTARSVVFHTAISKQISSHWRWAGNFEDLQHGSAPKFPAPSTKMAYRRQRLGCVILEDTACAGVAPAGH